MSNRIRITSMSVLLAAILVIGLLAFTRNSVIEAQDETPVVCDSSLVLLLLIAEKEFDYLSERMDSEAGMPSVDFGQYDLIITDTVAMKMATRGDMTEEQMAEMEAMEAMIEPMMEMDTNAMLDSYAETTGMEGSSDTLLEPSVVADESEVCTALRTDVERFLLAHLVADSKMMMEEGR